MVILYLEIVSYRLKCHLLLVQLCITYCIANQSWMKKHMSRGHTINYSVSFCVLNQGTSQRHLGRGFEEGFLSRLSCLSSVPRQCHPAASNLAPLSEILRITVKDPLLLLRRNRRRRRRRRRATYLLHSETRRATDADDRVPRFPPSDRPR